MNYNYNYDYNFGGMDPDWLSAFGAAAMAVLLVIAIIGIALAVLYIIGMYKLLKKGNKHPVGAFISPVGTFQLMELSGMNPWWMLIAVGLAAFSAIPLLGLVGVAGLIYMAIIYSSGVAKSFGKEGAGFVVGLVLLHPIFIFILGIGKDEYVGKRPAKDFLFNKEGVAPKE